ncbi:D-amino acid dehydrogenase [soil metagenome]
MKIIVLGAGIIGISTAWHLLDEGHEVTVVDRQADAAMEASFANGAQISVSYCEPWANRDAPLKMLKWLFRNDAPLLFRPTLDWQQWRWGLRFLGQCNDVAFERNLEQIVALGAYSHAALKELVQRTAIEYQRLERGIAHYYTDQKSFDAAAGAAAMMRKYGVARQVVSREELLRIEPAYRSFAHRIVGGTYTASDESGDARVFTQELARRCAARGATIMFGHSIEHLEKAGGEVQQVLVRDEANGRRSTLKGDAYVAACGAATAPLLRTVGVDLPIYPGKGYSATFTILRPELAPSVSTIDDEVKCALSRLGGKLRVAGTIELSGWNATLGTPVARARCQMLAERVETVLPGACDTRSEAEGGQPHYWSGLRPATPTNIPYIGRTRVGRLWVNAGHGTLGWTHGAGSGKAIAALISHKKPQVNFDFHGFASNGELGAYQRT